MIKQILVMYDRNWKHIVQYYTIQNMGRFHFLSDSELITSLWQWIGLVLTITFCSAESNTPETLPNNNAYHMDWLTSNYLISVGCGI